MPDDISLTGDQRSAVTHSAGRLRIIACPGSGKTETIARRIAQLINSGEKPEGIAAITFTEKAAGELKLRIRKILESEFPQRADFGDMFIGTIHAFCLEMLREIDPVYRTYDVLDGPRRVAFLAKGENYYNNIGLVRLEKKNGLRFYSTIRRFISSADIIITEQLDPESLPDTTFAEVFGNYLSTLENERYFDFPTIIKKLENVIEGKPGALQLIAHRTRHLVVDEFQDVDILQGKLIDLISRSAKSVAVVGDDDQGIYHWRGTDVGIMIDFGNASNGECTDITLGRNFRSTAGIVDLATGFIKHNSRRISKLTEHNPALARKYERGDIQAELFADREKEMDFIVSRIRDLLGTDFTDKSNRPYSLSYSDMAILTRTNELASEIIDRLDREGIPSVASSGESIFERPEIIFALDCIAYVFATGRWEDGKTYAPDETYLRQGYLTVFRSNKFPDASQAKFMRAISEIRKEISLCLDRKPRDYLGGLGLQEIYHRVLQAMGADRFDFGDVYSYNLAALSEAISDYESVWVRLRASEVKYFFSFISAYGDSSYQDPVHQDQGIIDAVRVMTIHKAKGLEFPVVFIPDFVSHRKPPPQKLFVDRDLYDHDRYYGNTEDERRVYYTALTRSEKYIFMTGSKSPDGKGRLHELNGFLGEMPSQYISTGMPLEKPRSGFQQRIRVTGEYETSYSDIISYIRCPQDFRLRNVYGFNAGVPPGFGYGTCIHNTLNMIHRNYLRKDTVPDEAEIEQITSRLFNLRYATGNMKENMLSSAVRIVKNYVRLHSTDFSRILETEKRFEFILGNSLINGQIDLIKRVDSGGRINSVEIIDFKSEKKDGAYSADYDRQLRYYAIACLESLDLRPEKAFVHHLDANGPGEEYTEVDISEPKLRESRLEIEGIVRNITSKNFPPKPSEKRCSECDYTRICSFRK